MELIQIDTIKWVSTSYINTQLYSLPAAVFVDAETGVVYFNGMYPRYDANGRVMVIPKDQLPAIIARGRAQAAAAAADKASVFHGRLCGQSRHSGRGRNLLRQHQLLLGHNAAVGQVGCRDGDGLFVHTDTAIVLGVGVDVGDGYLQIR